MVEDGPTAYLDHAAGAPIDPRVRAAMARFLEDRFANPDALHEWAREPAEALDGARRQVAGLIGADPAGLIFTAGDTEARNLAVKGVAAAAAHLGAHLVLSAVEHPATVAACRTLTRRSGTAQVVPVGPFGHVDAGALAAAVTAETILVNIAHGQHEIGTVQDIAGLIAAVRTVRADVPVHVDAGATAGLLPIDVDAWGCDLVSLGGGSMGGPRWCGALWVRPGTRLHPLIEGGLQEGGKRGGAHDLPGIVGLGAAAAIAQIEMAERAAHMTAMASRLIDALLTVPGVRVNGPRTGRLPGHVQVSVDGAEGETLTLALATRGVAASPGSACSAVGKASPVLEAIGVEPPWTHSAVLFTLAPSTTTREIDLAAAAFAEAVASVRVMSPIGR